MAVKILSNTLRRGLLATALLAAGAGGYAWYEHAAIGMAQAVPVIPTGAAPVARPAGLPDFASIVAEQGPAVVNISVAGSARNALPRMDPSDPMYEFFRRFRVPAPQGNAPTRGEGSGFIVSPDGVILTNAHVVADAETVMVKLTDKREFKAKVVGFDRTTDVAVLRIAAGNLPTVRIGDPKQARVGDWVLAIGSPFGFENSVTAGIISAKSRALPDEGYVPFLQTDVAINPGNSGGPLFNLNGEVIGINSQIYSRSGGYQGLSFAIPIDMAMKVERQLLEHGKVSRGRLGVVIQEVDQSLADSFGLAKPQGALISSVEQGSPADKAGLEAGDVILRFNGKEIGKSSELPPLVADIGPGARAGLEIWRGGKVKEISLAVGEMVADATRARAVDKEQGRLGLALRPLSEAERKRGDGGTGLVVESVADGPAARAGIRPGDVILAVNGERVESLEKLGKAISSAGKRVALLVQRGEHRLFVPVSLG